MNQDVTINGRLLWVGLIPIGGAVLLALLAWGAIGLARWHCEQKLAWMGYRGTTPPYSFECHVDIDNRGLVPLGQVQWRL